MKKRGFWWLVMVFALALALAVAAGACGDEGDETSGDTAGGDEELYYVMAVHYPTAPFQQAFRAGALEKAEEVGARVEIKDGQDDSLKIMDIMDNAITQGADGFIMAGTVDLKAIVPGIERLNEAGIPVCALDSSPEGGEVAYYISFDLTESSERATEAFIQGVKDRNGGEVPEGVVICVEGPPQDMFSQACVQGFKNVMADYPQLEVDAGAGNWNNDDSSKVVADKMTRHGDKVKGVYVITPDIMGPGAVEAIRSQGEDPADYGICGICIGPEGLALLENNEALAIVEQPAKISAEMAVDLLTKLNRGEDVPQIGDTITEEGMIWSPAPVIDNPWAEGAFIKLNAPVVPMDVPIDEPQLWENELSYLWEE
jgi:ribose transport system substrate-binding protein